MLAKPILFCGLPAVVMCDGRCSKAWGVFDRPRQKLSDDPDDFEYFSDDELGEAPAGTSSTEGDVGKPTSPEDRLNWWCVRACERSRLVPVAPDRFDDRLYQLPDFSQRRRNKPAK